MKGNNRPPLATYDGPIRVALVDNHRLVTELLKTYLDDAPRTEVLFEAENGLHMQEQLAQHGPPDVMVMDIRMPGMDGYRSAEWLRDEYPGVRILILTAVDDPDMVAQMHVLEVMSFAYKADGFGVLYEAIVQVADNGVYRNERQPRPSRFDPYLENLRGQLLRLRQRKYEFMEHICEDIDLNEVANRMDVTRSAVKRYTEALYEQYDVHSRHALVRRLFETGALG